jgi:exonuclease SbcC
MNLQSAREKLGRKLTNVSEVAAGVLRGVRRSNERDVAAYVFDLNNRLPDTVGDFALPPGFVALRSRAQGFAS